VGIAEAWSLLSEADPPIFAAVVPATASARTSDVLRVRGGKFRDQGSGLEVLRPG